MNDIIFQLLSLTGIPASKDLPAWPDWMASILMAWQGGKPMTWDITVVSTLAQSYLHASGHSAAGAAELAVSRKEAKYSCLPRAFLLYQSHSKLWGQ